MRRFQGIGDVIKSARAKSVPTIPWHLGYGGLAICEYYLRTGDKEVLPMMQARADILVRMENNGGWGQREAITALTYGGGGGHLNAASLLCAAYLIMAKECGLEVPEETLQRVVAHYYRYAGRGNVPYGNGKPETGFTDNGKNGKNAIIMAAAANLTPNGEDSVYARARDTTSQFAFYSTGYMLHGHTGGGIGEIWRSASMGLLHEKTPNHYREFMDNRRWHYEMSRRFDGSFGILGGERYDNPEWGVGYALTFTVPRKTLRLTGAPPTKFSKQHPLPERPWGTAEDDDFASMLPAKLPDGTVVDLSNETMADSVGLALIMKRGKTKLDTNHARVPCRDHRQRPRWIRCAFPGLQSARSECLAPFGAINGKLETKEGNCQLDFCRHGVPMRTLWENEVLLLKGKFKFPALKEGHRYRFVIGGMSHVGAGEGYRIYVNGKLFQERKRNIDRREGAKHIGGHIHRDWWSDFNGGETEISFISFMGGKQGWQNRHLMIWVQEMEIPPLGESDLFEAILHTPMTSSTWQALQDPDANDLNPDEGKFQWDGTFVPNPIDSPPT